MDDPGAGKLSEIGVNMFSGHTLDVEAPPGRCPVGVPTRIWHDRTIEV